MITDDIRKINRIPNNETDYYEDSNHNVFLDSWGQKPLFCKDCHVQQRCDVHDILQRSDLCNIAKINYFYLLKIVF
jgi:hypothetical protein